MTQGAIPVVEREDRPTGGVYQVTIEGHTAQMAFSRAGERLIIIDHTDVPEALRGRRVGNMLLERAIADMRATGGKIFPLCPFAASQFRKHPEYRDVLST
jgi:predicted GNAT family acetyltransferase